MTNGIVHHLTRGIVIGKTKIRTQDMTLVMDIIMTTGQGLLGFREREAGNGAILYIYTTSLTRMCMRFAGL
jgi:hypothetical protein